MSSGNPERGLKRTVPVTLRLRLGVFLCSTLALSSLIHLLCAGLPTRQTETSARPKAKKKKKKKKKNGVVVLGGQAARVGPGEPGADGRRGSRD